MLATSNLCYMRNPLLCSLAIVISQGVGCTDGYRHSNEKIEYVTWDAGHGFRSNELMDVDPDSFESLGQVGHVHFAKDNDQVYLNSHVINGADPATFELLEGFYSKDADQVFSGTINVKVADVSKFKVLRASDNTLIKVTRDADSAHFRKLDIPKEATRLAGGGWATDGTYVFFGPVRLENADPSSFSVLSEAYAKDDDNAYFRSFQIEGADAESFRATGRLSASDRNGRYLMEEKLESSK